MIDKLIHYQLNNGRTFVSERSATRIARRRGETRLACSLLCGSRGRQTSLDNHPGWLWSLALTRQLLVVVISHDSRPRLPIVTLAACAWSGAGRQLWRDLHGTAPRPLATDPDAPPPGLWSASRLDAGVDLSPKTRAWMGAFEIELAWGFVYRALASEGEPGASDENDRQSPTQFASLHPCATGDF
jgi:hypothetical protein